MAAKSASEFQESSEGIEVRPPALPCVDALPRGRGAASSLHETLEQLRRRVHEEPECPQSRRELAALCFEAGCLEEAIRHGQALLARQPESRAALDLLYAAHLRQGNSFRALRFLESLIRLDPLEATHHFRRGMILESQGDNSGAARAMARALALEAPAELRTEIALALRLLEEVQLRQILERADEDVVFRLDLKRDPESAVAQRGYYLTADAIQVLFYFSTEGPTGALPGWRLYRYH